MRQKVKSLSLLADTRSEHSYVWSDSIRPSDNSCQPTFYGRPDDLVDLAAVSWLEAYRHFRSKG